MKLTILGGGGFRVPLVHGALLGDSSPGRVTELVLYDLSPARLAAIAAVLEQRAAGHPAPPVVTTTTDLDDALRGADFVFSAIRVGGLAARTVDERVALDLGVLGQETTGPGGVAYALRTVPVALDIAERTRRVAPEAWFINFTNPAGIVTEAMQSVLGDRVIGICDSPIALARRAMTALGLDPGHTEIDYVGLNHLGWLRALRVDGVDRLPELIADPSALGRLEEGRLFGPRWIQQLGAIPNEYLYYYDYNREAIAAILAADQTRGEFLFDQQNAFYDTVTGAPEKAAAEWTRVREERDSTYMKEARHVGEERDLEDLANGGYEGVALAIMAAISQGPAATMILNVRNGGAVPGMPHDAVVEVPCRVDRDGAHPMPLAEPDGHMLGLMRQVKAVERLAIAAARSGSAELAVSALALHPLVDSVNVARALFEGYRNGSPELASVFG